MNQLQVLLQLQVQSIGVIIDDVAFNDDVTDDLLMSSQLVNQVLPSAVTQYQVLHLNVN